MTSRTKKTIVAVVAAAVVVLLFLFLWLSGGEEAPPVNVANVPANVPSGGLGSPGQVQTDISQVTEPIMTEEETATLDRRTNLKRIAAAFTERYGSYSNQGDYQNLEELTSLMTSSLAAETDRFVAQARAEGEVSPVYVGVTTRALVTSVDLYDEEGGTAEVRVNTQREEITSAGTRVYYQELSLSFVRIGEEWLVDTVRWLEENRPS